MEKITIRPARVSDAPKLAAIYAYYVENTAVTFEYTPPSADEFAERIRTISAQFPFIVAQRGAEIAGYAYVHRYHEREAYMWSVETSVYVANDARRGGVGSALYGALEELLRDQGFLNMYACIASPRGNDAYLTDDSERFHARIGFELIGRFRECGCKFGRWYDIVWMEKRLGEHVPDQPPVKPAPDYAALSR